ncbi:TPA: hypothetical protein ACH3X3_011843 [Trebouxia sp. C0006]
MMHRICGRMATLQVLHPKEESAQADIALDDGYGLTHELFVYDAVIRVSPFLYKGYGDSLIQDMFSALWQGTLAGCNALANCVGVALTDGHSE